jgi:acyl-CoA thioester hydrolase
MTFVTDIQVRFNDTDANGHLNNATYATYSEYARILFLNDVAGLNDHLILAHLSLDFIKQVKLGEEVKVTTKVKKLGNSSMTLYQEVLASGNIAAKIDAVVVQFDYREQNSKRISDDVRKKLEPYLKPEG